MNAGSQFDLKKDMHLIYQVCKAEEIELKKKVVAQSWILRKHFFLSIDNPCIVS